MANLCDTQFIITCGSKEPIINLWESMKELGAEKGYMPLHQLAEHYGIDYEKKYISVRGHVYWADIEANEEDDLYKLSFDVESAWSPTIQYLYLVKFNFRYIICISVICIYFHLL